MKRLMTLLLLSVTTFFACGNAAIVKAQLDGEDISVAKAYRTICSRNVDQEMLNLMLAERSPRYFELVLTNQKKGAMKIEAKEIGDRFFVSCKNVRNRLFLLASLDACLEANERADAPEPTPDL